MSAAPRPDASAAAGLARALRRVGYAEDAIHDLLGDDAYGGGAAELPVHVRRLDGSALSVAVRLLFLGLPVPRERAVRALGAGAVDALAATRLADVSADVVPLARVLPVGDLLVAADRASRGAGDPADWVAVYTPTSRLLDDLTPRRRVRRALDVGTGSGVQALRAASHARSVVATDLNPRALAYTELNAALNGLTNVEARLGDLYEPVAGEEFDLVTCNAPFVVSPEQRWAYRDSSDPADELSERVVRGAGERLAAGGHAALLVSWVARGRDDRDERVLSWVAATGCDGWVLSAWERDPLGHAAAWNLDDEPAEQERALEAWTAHLGALGVGWISEGAVLLHRRGGPVGVRVDEVDADAVDDASAQVVRAFAARASLASADDDGLAGARLAVAGRLRSERELDPRRRASGRVTVAGTQTSLPASDAALEVVESLDGRGTLRAHVARAARRRRLDAAAAARLERECARLARELLELGGLGIAARRR